MMGKALVFSCYLHKIESYQLSFHKVSEVLTSGHITQADHSLVKKHESRATLDFLNHSGHRPVLP